MPRRHRPKVRAVLLCPHCRSHEIDRDVTLFTGSTYTCRRCGYKGTFVLEEELPDAREVSGP